MTEVSCFFAVHLFVLVSLKVDFDGARLSTA